MYLATVVAHLSEPVALLDRIGFEVDANITQKVFADEQSALEHVLESFSQKTRSFSDWHNGQNGIFVYAYMVGYGMVTPLEVGTELRITN